MTDEWGRAAEVGGEYVKPAQLNGHLVIVYPLGYVPFIQTRFSGQSGKPSDGIAVDVVDLDDKDASGAPGKIYRNSTFMQAHLIAALKSQIGSKVLGTISQGVAKNGMNAPWIIVDLSADPMARERGSAWLTANPDFRPSPFVLREQRPMEQQPQVYPGTAGYQAGGPSHHQANPGYQQQPAGYQGSGQVGGYASSGGGQFDTGANPGYQQPPQQPPQYQQPAPPQQAYAPVQGSPQVSQEEMSVLQQHRAARAIAEAEAQREAQRQASFQDQPPF